MIVEISGKERQLVFGVGFVRRLDELYRAEVEGIQFGVGLTIAQLHLTQRNPAALADLIRCAIPKVTSARAVDTYVDEYAEEYGELEPLFEELEQALGKSSVVKSRMKPAVLEETESD